MNSHTTATAVPTTRHDAAGTLHSDNQPLPTHFTAGSDQHNSAIREDHQLPPVLEEGLYQVRSGHGIDNPPAGPARDQAPPPHFPVPAPIPASIGDPHNSTTVSNTSISSQQQQRNEPWQHHREPTGPNAHAVDAFHHTGVAIPAEATDTTTSNSKGKSPENGNTTAAAPRSPTSNTARGGVQLRHGSTSSDTDTANAPHHPMKVSKAAEIIGKIERAAGGVLGHDALTAKGNAKLAEVEAARAHNAEVTVLRDSERTGVHHEAVGRTGHGHGHGHGHGGARVEDVGGFAGQVPGTTGAVPHHANASLF